MHIAFIDPSFYHQGSLLSMRRVGYFPLTMPRLAALVPPGHRITLVYEKCRPVDLHADYDLVFFTTMGSNLVRAEELAAAFRRRGVKTVVGGYSVPSFADRCRERFDAVVIGDGEGILPQIIADAQAGRLQAWYENRAPSLAAVPVPRFDLVDPAVVGDIVPIEASRGCPNHCQFCAVSSLYGSGYRQVPADLVWRDYLAVRAQFGRRLYYFTDPNFTADMAHAKEIIGRLRGQGIGWLASVDVHALRDDEFLRLAWASGCFCLQVGFETLSQKNLGAAAKTFATADEYARLLARARAAGVPVAALMMVGFDEDDEQTFPAVLEFLETNKVPLGVVHPVVPVPGTAFHRRLAEAGRLLPIGPHDADGLHVLFRPARLSAPRLLQLYWRLSRRILGLRSVVRRFLAPHVLRNPIAYLILLITNLGPARQVAWARQPPGLYQ
jgi:radical SAM superfamily enzyme YgiQ (UPF0313 family)